MTNVASIDGEEKQPRVHIKQADFISVAIDGAHDKKDVLYVTGLSGNRSLVMFSYTEIEVPFSLKEFLDHMPFRGAMFKESPLGNDVAINPHNVTAVEQNCEDPLNTRLVDVYLLEGKSVRVNSTVISAQKLLSYYKGLRGFEGYK